MKKVGTDEEEGEVEEGEARSGCGAVWVGCTGYGK
jgi:hypothetical protein